MVTPLHLPLTVSFLLPPLLLPASLTSDASTAVLNTQLNAQATHQVQFQEYTIQEDGSKQRPKYDALQVSWYSNRTSNLPLHYTGIYYCA
jgi:hypothetical protein